MKPRSKLKVPARLARGRECFDKFRKKHKGYHRLPDSLWSAAVKLAQTYGVNQTAKSLRLDYSMLKKRLASTASDTPPDTPPVSGIHRLASGRPYQRMLFEDIEPAWVEVDTRNIRVERCLAFGGPWLGLKLLKRLGLPDLLEQLLPNGREWVPWPLAALVMVIARLCDAASELHIAEHFYKDSALCDVLGIPAGGINEDRLYRALDRLFWPMSCGRHWPRCARPPG